METELYKGYEIKIQWNDYIENPRESFDHIGTMVCFHRRYALGDDKHNFTDVDTAREYMSVVKQNNGVVLPLYLYDHSGLIMSTTPFTCEWDSGQVGWIYIEHKDILKEYGEFNEETRKKVIDCLVSEVKQYNRFLTGEVYCFTIEKDGEIIDSCGGFYDEPNYVSSVAKASVDAIIAHELKERFNKIKTFIRNSVPLENRQKILTQPS